MANLNNKDYLGVGWKFPFQINANTGGVANTSDQLDGTTSQEGQRRHISGALQQLVLTALGERFFRPEFGTRLHDLIFDPLDDTLLALLSYYVGAGIEDWEPRVELLNVDINADVYKGVVRIIADYLIRATYEQGSEVFPFYVNEGVAVIPVTGGE